MRIVCNPRDGFHGISADIYDTQAELKSTLPVILELACWPILKSAVGVW